MSATGAKLGLPAVSPCRTSASAARRLTRGDASLSAAAATALAASLVCTPATYTAAARTSASRSLMSARQHVRARGRPMPLQLEDGARAIARWSGRRSREFLQLGSERRAHRTLSGARLPPIPSSRSAAAGGRSRGRPSCRAAPASRPSSSPCRARPVRPHRPSSDRCCRQDRLRDR